MLLIACALMACFTFLSLGQVQLPDYSINFNTLGFSYEGMATGGVPSGEVQYTWSFFAISLLSAILPLIDIFFYSRPKLQRRICLFEIILILAVVAVGAVYGYRTFAPYQASWSSLVIAPVVSIVAVILAYRMIGSDMRKIRESDRLI